MRGIVYALAVALLPVTAAAEGFYMEYSRVHFDNAARPHHVDVMLESRMHDPIPAVVECDFFDRRGTRLDSAVLRFHPLRRYERSNAGASSYSGYDIRAAECAVFYGASGYQRGYQR